MGGADIVFALHSRSVGEHGTGAERGTLHVCICMDACFSIYATGMMPEENEQGRCG